MDDPLVRNDRQLAQNLQKDFRELAKKIRGFERDLNQLGQPNDTEQFRNDLRRRIDNVTHECKTVRESLLELEHKGANQYQIEKLKKQFTKEVDKLRDIVQNINLKERQFKPRKKSSTTQSIYNNNNQNNQNKSFKTTNEIDTPFGTNVHPQHGAIQPSGGGMQQQQQQEQFELHVEVDELERREEKVYGLLDQLTELNEIYGDLHELVEDQDEHIQVLHTNVEQAKEDVQAGVGHLDQAAKHQKNYRKKMCYLLIIILVIAAVIVGIYFITDKKK